MAASVEKRVMPRVSMAARLLAAAFVVAPCLFVPALAQNLIANPGFENNPPPNNGNNIGWLFSPWILGPGNQSNVVKVDGPGGFNYGNSGPQSDASNAGAGAGAGVPQHYADIVGVNDFYQAFTVPTCGGSPGQTRTATFSGWFSTRDNLAGNGAVVIRSGVGFGGQILAQQSVSLPAPPGGSGLAPWVPVTGTVSVVAGSQVSFVVDMDNNVNFDEASLTFNSVPCTSAPLTLAKTWIGAAVNDTATLTATRNGATIDTLPSVANAPAETDTDPTPVTVFQGEIITLAETLGSSNGGQYAATLACTGGGTLSGNTLTVNDSGVPIVCTYTNARRPRLTVTKVSNGGVGTFAFSGTNGFAAQNITTVTAGVGVSGAAQTLTAASTSTTITETAPPAGFVLSSINCTGLGAGGTATYTVNGAAGGNVVLDALATAPGSNIACTFVNSNRVADLSITKTNGTTSVAAGTATSYTVVVSNGGPSGADGAVATDTPGAGLTGCSVTGASAAGGAVVPATPANLLTAGGAVIPTLPAGGSVTFTVQCTVQ